MGIIPWTNLQLVLLMLMLLWLLVQVVCVQARVRLVVESRVGTDEGTLALEAEAAADNIVD